MGSMVRHLGNTTSSITSMHHLSDLWKGPRGTVLRIQALTVVAIITTFFLVAFGSCRRWSNRWIVQKGFFAAQVLSLSLGTYSIGIMQSSSVKSEMYPIWTVSLFTLFGCIDPVTNYNGLDYKGPLSKVVYGICLHCGYVLLMSISAISSVVGNITIGVLSGITFIKGFHRSMAFVQQSRMQNLVEAVINFSEGTCVLRYDYHSTYNNSRRCEIVDFPTDGNFPSVIDSIKYTDAVSLAHVDFLLSKEDGILLWPCYDACVAYCLSHSLQRHFLGLSSRKVDPETLEGIDYRWALKVIEIELAFLHDIFFTGSAFLHYYQAKTASLWVFVSFIGICCVGVAAAIPGTMSSPRTASGPGGCTNVVGTTTSDLVITFCILASLALLQLMQLIRCWTSNWARLAVVCAYSREQRKRSLNSWSWSRYETPYWRTWWMRLKVFVATSTNWFDKYLWQDKIGQYSIVMLSEVGSSRREGIVLPRRRFTGLLRCVRLVKVLGLDYVWEVIWDLLGSDPNKRGAVRLDDDVKASIIDFLGNKINSDRLDGNWLSFHDDPHIEVFLPYSRAPEFQRSSQGQRYTRCVMTWYVVTWYCELEEQERERMQNGSSTAEEGRGCTGTSASYLKQAAQVVAGCFKKAAAAGGEENQNSYRRVANALSKYCAYLVVSVPELLPGLSVDTRREYDSFVKAARQAWNKDRLLKAMLNSQFNTAWDNINAFGREDPLLGGAPLVALMRRPDRWKALVDVWVRMLVYAAPYGNAEAHMQQLSRGGEFITHLWALLYHLGIREWKLLGNVLDVVTIDQAQRILTESFRDDKNEYILTQDNHAIVVAFLRSHSDSYSDELAAASELEKHVSFYGTTSPEIAKLFHIDPAANLPSLVLLKKEEEKLTLYDGEFKRYAIADFVSANKLPLVTTFTQKTVSSLDCYPIRKLIILLAVANKSSKFLPNFKEAAKSFKGKLLFVFVELDNEEAQHAAKNLLDITCTGQETRVFAYYPREEKIILQLYSELSLDNIKIFAQGFFEDKLYVSEPVPESNDEDVKTVVGKNIDQIVLDESKDVLLVIYKPDEHRFSLFMESAYNKLAKHLRGIDSLVIAKMDSTTNWHPRTKCYSDPTIFFYPAGRKRFEPIKFKGERRVDELYKFIKKHATIPFRLISTLEEVSSENGRQTYEDRIEEIPPHS